MMKQLNKLEVMKYEDLIQVKENMVISRTLIDDDCKKVILFAFDEGQDVNSEIYATDVLYSCIDGKMVVYLEDESYKLKKGKFIQVPKHIAHGIKAMKQTKFLMMINKGEFKDE